MTDFLFSKLIQFYPELKFDEKIDEVSYYSEITKEHDYFFRTSAIYLTPIQRIIKLIGKDCLDYLNRISTNDLIKNKKYSVDYTLFLNEKGRLIDKAKIFIFNDKVFLISEHNTNDKLKRWLEKFLITEDVNVNGNSDLYHLSFIGKNLNAFLTLLFGKEYSEIKKNQIVVFNEDSFQLYLSKNNINDYFECYDILISENYLVSFLDYLHKNFISNGGGFIGHETMNILRIEMGEPGSPNEINLDFNPYDLNLIKFVNYTKGCYIGQEVVARIDTYQKEKNNFCGFTINGEIDKNKFYEIFNNSDEISGKLTSAIFSELLNKNIGLGVINKKYNSENEFYIIHNDNRIKLKPEKLPFIK